MQVLVDNIKKNLDAGMDAEHAFEEASRRSSLRYELMQIFFYRTGVRIDMYEKQDFKEKLDDCVAAWNRRQNRPG